MRHRWGDSLAPCHQLRHRHGVVQCTLPPTWLPQCDNKKHQSSSKHWAVMNLSLSDSTVQGQGRCRHLRQVGCQSLVPRSREWLGFSDQGLFWCRSYPERATWQKTKASIRIYILQWVCSCLSGLVVLTWILEMLQLSRWFFSQKDCAFLWAFRFQKGFGRWGAVWDQVF